MPMRFLALYCAKNQINFNSNFDETPAWVEKLFSKIVKNVDFYPKMLYFYRLFFFYRTKIAVANTEPSISAAQTNAIIRTKTARLSFIILSYI